MLINDKVDAVFIPDSPSRIKATDYNQIKNEIQECITEAGLTPTKDVIQLPQALRIMTAQSGAEEVAKIEAAGQEQLDAINTAGQTQTAAVNAAGETQINNINTAGAQAVQDAQTAANTATAKATEAATSAGEASDSASAAASSATAAEGSASTATTQATNAADSAELAQKWATQTTAEVVSGQGYGAKYYADQAAHSSASIEGDAEAAAQSATEAAQSAQAAASSASLADIQNKITNCLTKIPQDINLTLENGELKLTNSYIYVPNGPDIFEKVNITTSRNWTVDANKTFLLYLNAKSFLTVSPVEKAFSGDTAPEGATYAFWYDTANNKIKYVANDGVWQELQTCLPVAVVSSDGTGKIARIDQVFNGFGYIGKTLFVLPGVEGLIPNGRKADGSLNNIKFSVNRLLTRTKTSWNTIYIDNNGIYSSASRKYNEEQNYNYELTGNTITKQISIGRAFFSNDRITSFNPKYVFHAVDYSGADFVIDSYSDEDGNWYRLWKSGRIEQGGYTNTGTAISFLKPFNTLFGIYAIPAVTKFSQDTVLTITYLTNTGFNSVGRNTGGSGTSFPFYWQACGQGAK